VTSEIYNQVKAWVEKYLDLKGADALEIGSYNVNGTVRDLFGRCCNTYTGIDMQDGPGVDVAMNAHEIDHWYNDDEFDIVIWLEAMEHDDAFWITMRNINRIIKPDGYVIMSAPGISFPYHAFPEDYWRFTEDAFRVLLRGWKVLEVKTVGKGGATTMAIARRCD
jgi:SAM-dependent methyltransferase